ncbi:DUF3267 domain-containing protein [Halorubrum sp. SS7]|uniref:DUF3267 domain-containing protein n=1 Tax=unclassified Halorubrum TaxID=2642239 RepID=UPI0010F7DCFD|nr:MULTISPECIES: DUF3267 domain-containing protein [unclassified Halorubrum]TKX53663.1 DUF3267 domain-containing protein [Halorubrum sp. SP3]TKX56309.1 DUF3267 domain-containing protein [Halorubrum sp. SS7]
MPEYWPPDGHTEPKEYNRSERAVFVLGVILTGLFGISTVQPIAVGADAYVSLWLDFAAEIGLSVLPALAAGVAIAGIGFTILFYGIVTPIHEAIHYVVASYLNLNPDFGFDEMWRVKNPRVVALSTNIPVWKNMLMLIAPFVAIGLLSIGALLVADGVVAGVAGVVLWVNSAASAQDLYHYLRLLRMDPKTKFANFERDGEIKTEYVVPEQ